MRTVGIVECLFVGLSFWKVQQTINIKTNDNRTFRTKQFVEKVKLKTELKLRQNDNAKSRMEHFSLNKSFEKIEN